MNGKFITLALVAAMIAVVVADNHDLVDLDDPETQLSLTPSNDEETAGLVGDATMFSDFCIKSRDAVIGNVKSQTNSLSATIFTMFFKNAAEIGQNALNVERDATERLGNQIRDPSAPISAAAEGNSADAMIVDGQQKIAEAQIQPRTFVQAVISTIGATGNTVASNVVNSIHSLTNSFGLNKVGGAISKVCETIARYEEENRAAFAKEVASMADKYPQVASTPFESVACLTTRRISRLDGICKFALVAKDPVSKIMRSMQ